MRRDVIEAYRAAHSMPDLSQPDNEATQYIDWDYCDRCKDTTKHRFTRIAAGFESVMIRAVWNRPSPNKPGELVPCTPFERRLKVTTTLRACLACEAERS